VKVTLLLNIVDIPVASDVDTQVDLPYSTVQPCDIEWHLTVSLIHEYLQNVRHSATVSTQGKQKYFVVGGPGFGSRKVQDIHHFYKAIRPSVGPTHPLFEWVTGICLYSKEARA
jgi:hypothetical protein